jgi:hypothetical protein
MFRGRAHHEYEHAGLTPWFGTADAEARESCLGRAKSTALRNCPFPTRNPRKDFSINFPCCHVFNQHAAAKIVALHSVPEMILSRLKLYECTLTDEVLEMHKLFRVAFLIAMTIGFLDPAISAPTNCSEVYASRMRFCATKVDKTYKCRGFCPAELESCKATGNWYGLRRQWTGLKRN